MTIFGSCRFSALSDDSSVDCICVCVCSSCSVLLFFVGGFILIPTFSAVDGLRRFLNFIRSFFFQES